MTAYVNHITKSIRTYYKKRVRISAIFLAGLIVLSIFFPVFSLLFPGRLNAKTDPAGSYRRNVKFVRGTVSGLYFTGYTRTFMGRTNGYYYYTMMNGRCVIVLLKPETSEMGLSEIPAREITAEIMKDPATLDTLLRNMARDLSWNAAGIEEAVSPYMLSEPDADGPTGRIIKLVVLLAWITGLAVLIRSILAAAFPVLSRPVRRLAVYGDPRTLLRQAEEELRTLPQLATEDMFITEHWFIETSKYGVALVPITKILWIYKYSTLHKFLWHHFSISYTLYITAEKHRYIRCPKNTKSNIDGIMDYLSEANHNILVGFSEENRQKVEAVQGDFMIFRKIWQILSKKI